jgi:hypothetical protein
MDQIHRHYERSEAIMKPHGLPHRFAPRNDAIWSGLRIWHIFA